jgi:small GTP-binding protein
VPSLKDSDPDPSPSTTGSTLSSEANPPIIVTVIGRPNVGKSTLVNRFVGYERMKTGPQAGITTDAVQTAFLWKKHPISIVDTAGMRRKTAGRATLEHLSCRETQRALMFTHVALVVVDASAGIDRQDLIMVDKAWEEGRGVVVVLNKWDQVSSPQEWLRNLPPSITRHVVCPVSAVTGWGLNGVRQMEPSPSHRPPESLVDAASDSQSTPHDSHPSHQNQVHDTNQNAPPHVCLVWILCQRVASKLSTLSHQSLDERFWLAFGSIEPNQCS